MDTEPDSDSEEYEHMSPEDDYDVSTLYSGRAALVHLITSALSEMAYLYQMIDDTYEYPEVLPFQDSAFLPPPEPDEACIWGYIYTYIYR